MRPFHNTDSSHQTDVDAHELHPVSPTYPAASISPEQAGPGRVRVRFNSSANIEVPPPNLALELEHEPRTDCVSETHPQPSSENRTPIDQHIVDAQELLNAHSPGYVPHPSQDNDTSETQLPHDKDLDESYAVTGNTNGGIFYQLLQAYKTPLPNYPENTTAVTSSNSSIASIPPAPASATVPLTRTETGTGTASGTATGTATPSKKKKWYNADKAAQSQDTLATLVGASAKLANPNSEKHDERMKRPQHKRTTSGGLLAKAVKLKESEDVRIKIHVANILKRQQYIIRMCRALMLFGAPTHRLEEYLAMTAKVLEINSQFLYIPGCMLISYVSF